MSGCYNVGMTQKRTIPRRAPFDLAIVLSEYLTNRSMRERAEYHESQLKGRLMTYLQTDGDPQPDGHRSIELEEPLPYTQYRGGHPVAKKVTGIERKCRVSVGLNEERTMALLKKLGLLDRCTVLVMEVDEDEVLAANYEGAITDEQLKALYDESESFAFYLNTEEP